MKVLLIGLKWFATKVGRPDAIQRYINSFHNTYKDQKDYVLETRFICEEDIWSQEKFNQVLLESDYDIAIVNGWKSINVTLETAKKIGKKLFIIIWDTHNLHTMDRQMNLRMFLKSPVIDTGVIRFENSLYEYSQHCNILVIDNGYGKVMPNVYCVFEPMDRSVLYPMPEEEKKHELAFVGSMYEQERQFYLQKFNQSNIKFTQLGGKEDGEEPLSYEDWARIHRESKIEFCFNGNAFLGARKGRVWEIASCGNFMLCTVPNVYKYHRGSWFVEGTHFVSFNEQNYKDVINYYLNNPLKRMEIANNMHQLYLEKYTEDIWWSNLFKYAKDK